MSSSFRYFGFDWANQSHNIQEGDCLFMFLLIAWLRSRSIYGIMILIFYREINYVSLILIMSLSLFAQREIKASDFTSNRRIILK